MEEEKINVWATYSDFRTLLHLACDDGDDEKVKLLLDNDARPCMLDWFCDTPLHIACRRNHSSIIDLLLQHDQGIVVHLTNKSGLIPVLCIPEKESRDIFISKYRSLRDAWVNTLILNFRQVISDASNTYIKRNNSIFFRYGITRARSLTDSMEVYTDPFGNDDSLNRLELMISRLITHLERMEWRFGFSHKGNLYVSSQDYTLIKGIYKCLALKSALYLTDFDRESRDISYLSGKRTELVNALNELAKELREIIVPSMISDFYIL